MTKEKWADVLSNILDNFEVLEHEKESYEEDGGVEIEYIVFLSPLGKVRLDFVEKAMVLGKKTNYSNRAGAETKIDYIYSPTEKTVHLEACLWSDDEDDWVEIDSGKFSA